MSIYSHSVYIDFRICKDERNNLIWPKSKDILVFEYDVELKKSEEPLKEKNRNEKETLDKANKKNTDKEK